MAAMGLPPDRAAWVALGGFDGPLALLLGLIEQRKLDILTVPLGDLAASFLDAVSALEETQLPHISAFITVASQLILIKSRAILPRPPAHAALVLELEDEALRLNKHLR